MDVVAPVRVSPPLPTWELRLGNCGAIFSVALGLSCGQYVQKYHVFRRSRAGHNMEQQMMLEADFRESTPAVKAFNTRPSNPDSSVRENEPSALHSCPHLPVPHLYILVRSRRSFVTHSVHDLEFLAWLWAKWTLLIRSNSEIFGAIDCSVIRESRYAKYCVA